MRESPAGNDTGNQSIRYAESIGSTLLDIVAIQSEWSQVTFGLDCVRGPQGPLAHLAKETEEAKAAYENVKMLRLMNVNEDEIKFHEDECLTEFADIGILWLDALRRAGFTLENVIESMRAKQQVNIARKWPTNVSADSPVFHVNEGEVG
jgi:hypothetical protein